MYVDLWLWLSAIGVLAVVAFVELRTSFRQARTHKAQTDRRVELDERERSISRREEICDRSIERANKFERDVLALTASKSRSLRLVDASTTTPTDPATTSVVAPEAS